MKDFKITENPKIETGFVVPENYFENLESRILTEIETNEVKVISIFKQSKFWIAAIAAVFVIGLFLNIYNKFPTDETISNEEFLTYQTDLSTEDLAEQLSENDLKTLEVNLNIYDQETINSVKENL